MRILLDGHDVTLVGGIERFVANLANALTSRGHEVVLFTYAPQGARPHFPLLRTAMSEANRICFDAGTLVERCCRRARRKA